MTKYRDYRKETDLLNSIPIKIIAQHLGINITHKNKEDLIQCPNPGHNDSKPSCVLFEHVYYCRSQCAGTRNESGGAFKLIQLLEKDEKPCDWAVNKGLISAQYTDGTKAPKKQKKKISTIKKEPVKKRPPLEDHHHIYSAFLGLLTAVTDSHYLVSERGLCPEVLKDNQVKALDKDKDYTKLLLNIFTLDELLKSGLLGLNKDTQEPYFIFKNCNAVFPCFVGDKIISMQGKLIKGKYLHLLGNLRTGFYIPKLYNKPDVYICEGAITALSFIKKKMNGICLFGAKIASNEELVLEGLKNLKNVKYKFSVDLNKAGYQAYLNLQRIFKVNDIPYDKEIFDYFTLAEVAGATQQEIIKMTDYNDFMVFMETKAK